MCIPLLGALIAAAGAVMTGVGQSQQLKAQETAMRHNEKVAILQAEDALSRGEAEVKIHAQKVRQLLAEQRMATPGVDMSSPLYQDIYDDTELFAMLDAEMILENSRRESWTHYNRAQGYNIQAEGAAGAQGAVIAGTVLGAASAVGEGWYRYSELKPAKTKKKDDE